MYKILTIGLCITYLFTPCSMLFGELQSDEKINELKFFRLNPLRSLSFGYMYLSTTYPLKRYTFPNQDGTFATKGFNYFLSASGDGNISTLIDFYYDFRFNNIEGIRFKKGSLFLRTNSVSLEVGRNNIWLGNSHYGSLLLSNNAEPYTLVRFRTEQPFRIPYIGKFDYTLFHGWPRKFNIIGHQLSYYPVSWFEFNIKQTITYSGNYTFFEYIKMFTGREANVPGRVGSTDSRASFEIAANMEFLSNLLPVINNVRFYLEYAGEDLYAKWQKADAILDKDLWVGPFGFELLDTGILTGLQLTLENTEFIIEYAQNYKSHYIFYDPYNGERTYNISWYRPTTQPDFTNNDALMGHQMGSAAEMLTIHFFQSLSDLTASFIFSRRHRWNIGMDHIHSYKIGTAERRDSFTGMLQYRHNQFLVSFFLIYNVYNNVDSNKNLVINNPRAGVTANETLVGVNITFEF